MSFVATQAFLPEDEGGHRTELGSATSRAAHPYAYAAGSGISETSRSEQPVESGGSALLEFDLDDTASVLPPDLLSALASEPIDESLLSIRHDLPPIDTLSPLAFSFPSPPSPTTSLRRSNTRDRAGHVSGDRRARDVSDSGLYMPWADGRELGDAVEFEDDVRQDVLDASLSGSRPRLADDLLAYETDAEPAELRLRGHEQGESGAQSATTASSAANGAVFPRPVPLSRQLSAEMLEYLAPPLLAISPFASPSISTAVDHGPPTLRLVPEAATTAASASAVAGTGPELHDPHQVCLAIIGSSDVSRTFVLDSALRKHSPGPTLLQRADGSPCHSRVASFIVSKQRAAVEALDFDSEMLEHGPQGVVWPTQCDQPDGALVLHHVGEASAVVALRRVLDGLWRRGGLCTIVLAVSETAAHAVKLDDIVDICNLYGAGIVHLEGNAAEQAAKTRNAFGWMIRRVLATRGVLTSPSTSRSGTSLGFTSSAENRRSAYSRGSPATSFIASIPPSPVEEKQPVVAAPPLTRTRSDSDFFLLPLELIDKWLQSVIDQRGDRFATFFLTVYQRFARPREVLDQLIKRFEELSAVGKGTLTSSDRLAQERLCEALADWLQQYPDDFTASATYERLRVFLEGLVLRPWTAAYAVKLLPELASIVAGDDVEETLSSLGHSDPIGASLPMSAAPSTSSAHSADGSGRAPGSQASNTTAASSIGYTLLDYSDALLECPEAAIAVQILRIAWEAFERMTPRDLLRYGSRPRRADPVARSIWLVNYLSDWTCSVILAQTKHKHRARMIEKMIGIAGSLRQLDCFDGLVGVLGGLNAQPVYRLEACWAVIKDHLPDVYKRFKSLNTLMSSNNGYSAYRLALANARADRLPALSCTLADIARLREGKRDMQDGRVNWSKLSQMAAHAQVVAPCRRNGPPDLPNVPEAARLILGVPVLSLDGDALYSLSYTIQPRGLLQRGRLRKLIDTVTIAT